MAATEAPAVARRRLRLALRRFREAAGLTQGQVAAALEWSLSKVNRIESGDVTVSGTDLRALLELLDVTDAGQVADLTETARASRRRGWWDQAKYREHHTAATLQLFQFESEATAIRTFQMTLFPGLIQTRRYAEAIIDYASDELPPDVRAARLESRLERWANVMERDDPPEFFIIVDESVLLRPIGGPAVFGEQLRHVLDLIKKSRIVLRVAPFAEAARMNNLVPFTVLDLGEAENAILYREIEYVGDELIHSPNQVHRYRAGFEDMWAVSMSVDVSSRLVEERIAAILAALDRNVDN